MVKEIKNEYIRSLIKRANTKHFDEEDHFS